MNTILIAVLIASTVLAGIMAIIAFETKGIERVWAFVTSALKNKQLDAIVIGLAGAGTFIASALVTLVRGGAWHPQAFGVGFGALASGLGILFKLRRVSPEEEQS